MKTPTAGGHEHEKPGHYPDAFYEFVKAHLHESPARLRLAFYGKTGSDFSYQEAIDQIEARRKSGAKLNALTCNPRFIFPATICAEQATSSMIAAFHASLIAPGSRVLDLTAGLGSDVVAFAKVASCVTAIERDPHFCDVLRLNSRSLGCGNINVENAEAVQWIGSLKDSEASADAPAFDTVYIDPHRRGSDNSRTYAFQDCEPDISALAPRLLELAPLLMVKASPMLDISAAAEAIAGTEKIYVVSEGRDCKELLVFARPGAKFNEVIAVSIRNGQTHQFAVPADELGKSSKIALVANQMEICAGYLYEPDASMMKLRCWDALSARFINGAGEPELRLLHPNTNLFHSSELLESFPGRIFRVNGIIGSRDMKHLRGDTANTATRNYPLTADQLNKKLKLKSAATDRYIYGVRAGRTAEPVLLDCNLLND